MPLRRRDDAIVLMAIGRRHLGQLASVRRQFERYAEACRADLVVITAPPDPARRRNILWQKMLLPHLARDWERVVLFDLDMLIARDAEPLFDYLPDDAGLAAVIDPRDTPAYSNAALLHWRLPEYRDETHLSYFSSRGYPPFPPEAPVIGSINGGALLCRPALVADLFRDVYTSPFEMRISGPGFSQRPMLEGEEAPMAYVSQVCGLFAALPERFNRQMLYVLFDDPGQPAVRWVHSAHYRNFRRIDSRLPLPASFYPRFWRELVAETLAGVDLLHFAGGFPFRGLAGD
jgi:hypothetical protein